MTTQQAGSAGNQSQQSGGQHDDAAASVGHLTSGEAGATPGHETMQETGGSGGEGLTRNQVGPGNRQQEQDAGAARQATPPEEPAPIVRDSGARGAQDTRSRQAGGSETGLGVPETGANQSPADLAPRK